MRLGRLVKPGRTMRQDMTLIPQAEGCGLSRLHSVLGCKRPVCAPFSVVPTHSSCWTGRARTSKGASGSQL